MINENKAVRFLFAAALLMLLQAGPASATWSIAAVDPQTKQVGIAGASCTNYVYGIAGTVPGRGVIVAQAMSNMEAKSLGKKMLSEGASPQDILKAIINPSFDSDFAEQQYGIVALGFENKPAVYTGTGTPGAKGALQGYGVTVQGNVLTGEKVLKNALNAFRKTAKDKKSTLADRLVAALEAGTEGKGGDSRCGEQRASSAFVVVESPEPDDDPYLLINITGRQAGENNPIEMLRKKYDEWRLTKPGGSR